MFDEDICTKTSFIERITIDNISLYQDVISTEYSLVLHTYERYVLVFHAYEVIATVFQLVYL